MTRTLRCIRMSPAALEAVSDLKTIVTFYSAPVNNETNRKIAATFDTPSASYWAVAPIFRPYRETQIVGIERRMDGRWCWVIEGP